MALSLSSIVKDQNGIAVAGASVYVYDAAGVLATLTDILAQPIVQPVKTGDTGYWYANAASATYRIDYYWGGRLRLREVDVGLAQIGATGAAGGNVESVGLFTALAGVAIPIGTARVSTSGYASVGVGAGTYVADALADAALFAAHPRFVFQAADLRYFRLLSANGELTVEQGGTVGQETAILDETVPSAPVVIGAPVDNRAAIQAAIAYANANGIATVKFLSRFYAVRRRTQTAGALNFHTGYPDNALLFSTASITLESAHPSGTKIVRLKANGAATNLADQETFGGYACRGGALFMVGQAGAAINPALHSFTARNVLFDGGLRKSMGLTFEVLDKGLWQANDYNVGHITLEGLSGFIGWCSECVYGAAVSGIEAAKRIWDIGPECIFGESGGTGLNPNGQTMRVRGALTYNCLGFEGWTGGYNNHFEMEMRDCAGSNASTIQGGTVNQDALRGGYYVFTNPVTGGDEACWGIVRMKLTRSPLVIGSYVDFEIDAIDCTVSISDGAAFNDGSHHVRGYLRSTVDTTALTSAVFLGGNDLRQTHIKVDCFRSKPAETAGRAHIYVATGYGAFNGDNTLEVGQTYGAVGGIYNAAAAMTGKPMKFAGAIPQANGAGIRHDMDTTATFDFKQTGPHLHVNFSNGAPAARTYTVALPVDANVLPGMKRSIVNFTKNDIAGGGILRIPAAHFRQGRDVLLGPEYVGLEIEYGGNDFWKLTVPPIKPTFSVAYDPPNLALGASTAIQVLATAYGVLPGDKIEASFSLNTAGARITCWASAANTISYYFTNENGANPLDLAAGTIVFEVS